MAQADAPPSLSEITQLIRSELSSTTTDDEIRQCGGPALAILAKWPDTCLQLAYQKLHDVPYKEVKKCWRRLYTDAALWKALRIFERAGTGTGEEERNEDGNMEGDADAGDWITQVVRTLDMALILTGAPGREELIELVFSALGGVIADEVYGNGDEETHQENIDEDRPSKRRKLSTDPSSSSGQNIPSKFPTTIPNQPNLQHPIPRVPSLSLSSFQSRISAPETQTPIIIENAIDFWPALGERPWNNPQYLLSHTLNGRRIVPVEIGRSYTDESWGQKILSFGEFVKTYMLDSSTTTKAENEKKKEKQTGYLAQHDLFTQIPSLRADIAIPDYCYSEPPPFTSDNVKPTAELETPLLNAWFGPANTISPLHTDPYHNILSQVVGYKYIRLYAPNQTTHLYPRGVDEKGVDMGNTSQVDLDEAFEVWSGISPWTLSIRGTGKVGDGIEDKKKKEEEEQSGEEEETGEEKQNVRGQFKERFPEFGDAEYVEGVLGPGDCLYIPVGWWHYVRSLTPSFSVSFWWN